VKTELNLSSVRLTDDNDMINDIGTYFLRKSSFFYDKKNMSSGKRNIKILVFFSLVFPFFVTHFTRLPVILRDASKNKDNVSRKIYIVVKFTFVVHNYSNKILQI